MYFASAVSPLKTQSVISNVSRPDTSSGSTGNSIRKCAVPPGSSVPPDERLEGVLAARRGADAVTAGGVVGLDDDNIAGSAAMTADGRTAIASMSTTTSHPSVLMPRSRPGRARVRVYIDRVP